MLQLKPYPIAEVQVISNKIHYPKWDKKILDTIDLDFILVKCELIKS